MKKLQDWLETIGFFLLIVGLILCFLRGSDAPGIGGLNMGLAVLSASILYGLTRQKKTVETAKDDGQKRGEI
jgi:F0F1-type ATP synthase membrane subunit c/vacuolar-type H+-ATPase subunit K